MPKTFRATPITKRKLLTLDPSSWGPGELRGIAELLETTPVKMRSYAKNNRRLATDLREIARGIEEMLRTLQHAYLFALDNAELQATASVEFAPENGRLSKSEQKELGRRLFRYNEIARQLPVAKPPKSVA